MQSLEDRRRSLRDQLVHLRKYGNVRQRVPLGNVFLHLVHDQPRVIGKSAIAGYLLAASGVLEGGRGGNGVLEGGGGGGGEGDGGFFGTHGGEGELFAAGSVLQGRGGIGEGELFAAGDVLYRGGRGGGGEGRKVLCGLSPWLSVVFAFSLSVYSFGWCRECH